MTQNLAINTLNKVRQNLIETIEGILSKPKMFGSADAIEANFLQSLELLHIIDYPECNIRCGWNCFVNYVGKHYDSTSSLSFLIFTTVPDKNWLRVAEAMVPDLEAIWHLFKSQHPHIRANL